MKIIKKDELYKTKDNQLVNSIILDMYLLKERRQYFIHVYRDGVLLEGFTGKNGEAAARLYKHIYNELSAEL